MEKFSSESIRVIVITDELSFGGAERSSVDLSIALAQIGYHVTLVARPRRGQPSETLERLCRAGVKLVILPLGRLTNPKVIHHLIRFLRGSRPDVVIVHDGRLIPVLGFLKRYCGHPLLIYVKRGMWTPSNIWGVLLARTVRHIDAAACISHATATILTLTQPFWPTERIFVIHNGVFVPPLDALPPRGWLHQEIGLPEDALLIGTCARLDWVKGHQYTIEALSLILGWGFNVHLVIAGDGPFRNDLEKLVQQRGLAKRVHFLGWREDVHRVMHGLDVFVHLTLIEIFPYSQVRQRWRKIPFAPGLGGEGFGRAVAEACGVAVPVVASDCGGHREIIVDGQTGLLVPVADPFATAEAIVYLLENPDRARRMALAARQRILKHFSIEAMGRKYHHLIQYLLAKRSEQPR